MGRKDKKKQVLTKQQQRERTRKLFRYLSPLLYAFVTWFALISLVHAPFIKETVRESFVSFTTYSAYYFGKLFFVPIEMHGVPYLSVKGFMMQVVMECTAYNFYLFGLVLTLFARWTLKQKVINTAIFLAFIFLFNNLRFISMGYLGSVRPDLFSVIHDTVWNVLFGFMVFGIWAWREIRAQQQLKVQEAAS